MGSAWRWNYSQWVTRNQLSPLLLFCPSLALLSRLSFNFSFGPSSTQWWRQLLYFYISFYWTLPVVQKPPPALLVRGMLLVVHLLYTLVFLFRPRSLSLGLLSLHSCRKSWFLLSVWITEKLFEVFSCKRFFYLASAIAGRSCWHAVWASCVGTSTISTFQLSWDEVI